MASKLIRWACAAAAAIVALILLLLAVAHLPTVRARVLERARAYAASELALVLDANALDYNLLARSASLSGVTIAAPGQPPLLQADSVRVVLSRSLLRGIFEIESLELVRPRIAIVRHADGATNLPPSRAEQPQAATPLELGTIDIRQLELGLDDRLAHRTASVGPIDLRLDTSRASPRAGSFGPSPFTIRFGQANEARLAEAGSGSAPRRRPEPLKLAGTLAGQLWFDGARLAAPDLRVEAPDGRVELAGWMDVIADRPLFEAAGQFTLDLSRARQLAGAAAASLAGNLRGSIKANGPLVDPGLRLTLDGSDLAYRAFTGVQLSGEGTVVSGRLNVQRLRLTSPLGELDATGSLHDGKAGRVTIDWRGVDLDRSVAAAGVELPAKLGSIAHGRLTATFNGLDASDRTWITALEATGSTRLAPRGTGLSLSGDADLAVRSGDWSLKHSLTSAAASLSLDGLVAGRIAADGGDSTLDRGTRLRIDDVAGTVAAMRDAGVALHSPFAERLTGRLTANVQLTGTATRPVASATVAVRGLQGGDIPATDVDATLAIDRHTVRASAIEARLAGASVTASGQYAWSGAFDGRFDAATQDLDRLLRSFDLSSASVTGTARLAGTAAGTTQSPRAQATLTATGVTVDGTSVGAVNAKLAFGDNRVSVEAAAPQIAVGASGILDTRDPYAYQAEAAFSRTPLAPLIPARLRDRIKIDNGTIDGRVRAEGSLSSEVLRESSSNAASQRAERERGVAGAGGGAPAQIEKIEVRDLHVVSGNLRAHASGTLGRESTGERLELKVEGPLSDAAALAAPYLPETPLKADGSLSLDLQIGGTVTTPQPSGTATLHAASISYGDLPPAIGLSLDARIEPTRVVVDSLSATWQQAVLSAKADLPLPFLSPGTFGTLGTPGTPGTPGTLTARVTNVSPAVLAPFLSPSQLRELGGTLSATLTAEADALALDRVRAAATVDQGSIVLAGVPFSQLVPTRLRLANGKAAIEDFRWTSQGNELVVTGGADLASDPRQLDLRAKGLVDLRMLGAFVADVWTAGIATTDLTVTGPLNLPEVAGTVGIRDAEVRIDTPPLVASDVNGELRITSGRAIDVALAGLVNGGEAKITGGIDAAAPDDPRGRLVLAARNVAVEYPDGFATESNVDLTLTLGGAGSSLAGRIDVLNGTYREPLVISSGLLSGLQRETVGAAPASSLLSTLRLDVTVATSEDVRIDNNYGRLNLTANLRVVGTPAQPGAVGRIEATEDSEVYLAGNTYRIERLVIDLTDRRAISPSVSFLAETRVGSVPIEVALECPARGPCEREVRSLASGTTNAEAEDMLFGLSTDPSAAGEQLARLLSGEILGIVGRTVGLDTLRLEQGARGRGDIFEDPTLVAGEIDPASRLTLGERLGENVELVYSQDLAGGGFTWSTTYVAPYGMSLRAILFDDQSRSYEFRHEPRFSRGRRERPRRPPGARIADVRIAGTPGFPEGDLRGRLKLGKGDRFEFGEWQADRRRLEDFYHSRNFLEARVRARRHDSGDAVVLDYTIDRGPETALEIHGVDLPKRSEAKIRERWSAAVFDGFLERDARTILRDYLYQDGRLSASIDASVRRDDAHDRKTLRIDVTPGPQMAFHLRFTGNQAIPSARLYEVAASVGTLTAWLDPGAFEQAVERLYKEEGFLAADAEVLEPAIDGDPGSDGTSIVQVVVREGEPWTIGRVAFEGTGALAGTGGPESIDFRSGMRYQARIVAAAADKLERRFRQAGYLEAQVAIETTTDDVARRIDLLVRALPGPRSILTEVIVEGADPAKPLVARAIELTPGAPVSQTAIGRTRRSLNDSGVFRSVEIVLEPAPAAVAADGDRPVVARVRLQERPRYRFRYGFSFNDEFVSDEERRQRLAFAADLENRNLFGTGATAGISARISRDQQVGRLNLGANRFFGLPLRSNFFISRTREEFGSSEEFPTVSDVTELSFEQSYRLRRFLDLRYGYGLGRNRTFIDCNSPGCEPFDIRVRVARLTGGGLMDRRANPFDPSGGWFTSATFELSRPGIGSDLNFLKGFLQYFQFTPVGGRAVIASAARLGLARTFQDEVLIPSERYFAGGATSVRGYREDDLGPRSIFGDAEGGSAMLILNAEARFPLYRWIRGVGFVDMGNVYPTIGDISFADFLVGLGAGIRLDTPVGLIRFDLAAPANGRPFDPKWRVHFGLGHAF